MITSVVKISPGRAEALGAQIMIQIKLTRGEVMPCSNEKPLQTMLKGEGDVTCWSWERTGVH
jgi:hypothetical protein